MSLDDTVEQSATNETEFAINGCCSAPDIVPAGASVVRKSWVGVLKIGNSNEPVVDPQVWGKIPDSHIGETKLLAKENESSDHDSKTKIAQKNEFSVLGFEKRAGRVEMVDTSSETIDLALSTSFTLALVVIVASHVTEQVQRPAEKLLTERVDNGGDRGFFSQFINLVDELADAGSILLTSLRNEDHITLHISSRLVVLAV